MFKRVIVPLTAFVALLAFVFVVAPTGAIGEERQVGNDRYVFGGNETITDAVAGDLQVYRASVVIENVVAGNVLVAGGDITFRGAGRVDGNLIYAASRVSAAEGRVRGSVYPLASLEGAAASMNSNAVIASLLLAWLIGAVLVTLVSGREIRSSSLEVRTSVLHCFVLGLVALTSFVLTAIAFSYLIPFVIGIPLLAALAAFGVLTKIYGMIAVFHAVGTLVAGARNRPQLASRKWLRGDLAMVVLGVLLLGALRFVPVIGTIIWSLASIFGIGVALATRFGRREPWFLAVRDAVA